MERKEREVSREIERERRRRKEEERKTLVISIFHN